MLRVEFVNGGTQLLSSGSDGLLKLWQLTRSSSKASDEAVSSSSQKSSRRSAKNKSTSESSSATAAGASFAGECIRTYDEHAGKLWALATISAAAGGAKEDSSSGGDERCGIRVATGGADATLILWKDVTIAEQHEKLEREKKLIEQYDTVLYMYKI